MYKQQGFGFWGFVMMLFLVTLLQVIIASCYYDSMSDRLTALIPTLETSFNSASQKLKVTIKNKHEQKVGDLQLKCNLTMKSGSEGSVETIIFESIQTNEIKTFNISNLQYGDSGKNIPMSNIQNISSCRIVGFKEIKS